MYCESNTTRIADTFSGNTDKKYIHFSNPNSSNDPGFILHETRGSENNEGVLHLCPSDDNSQGDYVSIHGTNDPDVLKFHTNGLIETAANYTLQLTSATGIVTCNSAFELPDNQMLHFGQNFSNPNNVDIMMWYNGADFYMDFETADDNFYIRNSSDSIIFTFAESTGNFSAAGDVLPSTDNSGNVGTASRTWSNGRFTNLTIDSTLTAGDVLPSTDDTGNVGTSSKTWSNGRFTNLTIDTTLNVRTAIDLADSDVLRFGSSDDAKFFYDGSNNDFELELESACGDFLITDNGTTRFTFTKSNGNFTADGSVTGSSIIKSGGSSSEFLMADGSVTSASMASAARAYTFAKIL